jgi:hypothetical protein
MFGTQVIGLRHAQVQDLQVCLCTALCTCCFCLPVPGSVRTALGGRYIQFRVLLNVLAVGSLTFICFIDYYWLAACQGCRPFLLRGWLSCKACSWSGAYVHT